MSSIPGLGSGRTHAKYKPVSLTAIIGGRPTSVLLDCCAAISLIDTKLAASLNVKVVPATESTTLSGLGASSSKSFCVLDFEVSAVQPNLDASSLRFKHEFHLVDNLKPGVILGLEFIDGHAITIDPANDVGRLKDGTTFPIRKLRDPSKKAGDTIAACAAAEDGRGPIVLFVTADTQLNPSESAWVKVRPSRDDGEQAWLVLRSQWCDNAKDAAFVVGSSIVKTSNSAVLVTNVGTTPLVVPSNLPIAEAEDFADRETFPTGESMTLNLDPPCCPVPPAEVAALAAAAQREETSSAGAPFDARDEPDFADAAAQTDGETVQVLGHFNVGIDPKSGQPWQQIVDVLERHQDVFSLDGRPGHVDYPGMPITLQEGARLSAQPPRQTSPEKKKALGEALDDLIENGIVTESTSPVSYPVHMVPQRDGYRFCVDYRALNAVTVADRYPLQRGDDIFEALRGSSVFSALDAVKGYHQLDILPADRYKTAFACHRGLYEYTRIPFGLRNAPAWFQRCMDKMLGPLRWQCMMPYLDDIVVFTSSISEHAEALEKLFQRAGEMGLRFSPRKCHFALPSLKLLGRRVCADGVGVLEDKVAAIRQIGPPKTYHDLHHILGLFGYYRHFIRRYAEISAPLQELLQGTKYERKGDGSTLRLSDGTRGNPRSLRCPWSPKCDDALAHMKDELFKAATLPYADYNKPFLLYVDSSQRAHAAALHQQTLVKISPDPRPSCDAAGEVTAAPVIAGVLENAEERRLLSQQQKDDSLWSTIITDLENDLPRAGYRLEDGLLVRTDDDTICLPKSAMKEALHAAHFGHPGFTRTLLKASDRWWHSSLAEAVRSFVKHCPECLRTKLAPRSGRMDIEPDEHLGVPFRTISVDLVQLPEDDGKNASLILLDPCTKATFFQPTRTSVSATGVAEIIEDLTIRRGFRVSRIISDSEKRFVGNVANALARKMGAVLTPSVPHHQQANPVERYVQTAKNALRAMLLEDGGGTKWVKKIPALELALNSTPSTVSGYSPYELLYSHQPRALDALTEHYGVSRLEERLNFGKARLEQAVEAVREARRKQKERYDSRRRPLPEIKPNDWALVRAKDRPLRASRLGNTLEPSLEGPFKVTEILSDHRIKLAIPAGMEIGDTFDASQVQLAPGNDQYGRPGFLLDDGAEDRRYEPLEIVAERLFLNRWKQYRVRWRDSSRLTWEYEEDLLEDGCEQLIIDWNEGFVTPPPQGHPQATAMAAFVDDAYAQAAVDYPAFSSPAQALDQPIARPRIVNIDGVLYRLSERPIAFSAKKTSESESKLVGSELELSGLTWAFDKFKHFLEGSQLTVVTDHQPLEGILRAKDGKINSPLLRKLRARLTPYLDDIKFVYKPGKSHTNVDSLSRLSSSAEPTTSPSELPSTSPGA